MTLRIPDVPAGRLTQAGLDALVARETAIVARVNAGTNDPFEWLPVETQIPGHVATFYVLAQPLRIDNTVVGIGAYGLQQCADLLGAMLHTPKTLDLTYAARGTTIDPQTDFDPMRMLTNAWFERQTVKQDAAIAAAGGARGIVQTCGKPFTLGRILWESRAIGKGQNYGWHLPPGQGRGGNWKGAPCWPSVTLPGIYVLQQPGTEHGLRQGDYASTLELVRGDMLVDGRTMPTGAVAMHPELAFLISHEGALPGSRQPGVPQLGGRGGSPIVPPLPPTPDRNPATGATSSSSSAAGVAVGVGVALLAAVGVTLAVKTAKAQRARPETSSAPAYAGESVVESDRDSLAPNWQPLTAGDKYNGAVRAIAQRQNGAYAFRERGRRRVLYVGESHTRRLWKTLLRHMQPGTRATCTKRDPKRKGGCMLFADIREWTYKGDVAAIDVAIWITDSGAEAQHLEGELIERLEPEHNEQGYEEPDEGAPF